MNHPPGTGVSGEDVVGHPPDERQVRMPACSVGCEIRAALRNGLEGIVDECERVAVVLVEDECMEAAAARVPSADSNRQTADTRIGVRPPAERVRGKLATRPYEL